MKTKYDEIKNMTIEQKECKDGEWDKENEKCEGCDERNSPKTEEEERKNRIPVFA